MPPGWDCLRLWRSRRSRKVREWTGRLLRLELRAAFQILHLRGKQRLQEFQPYVDGFEHPSDDCIVTAANAEQFTPSLQARQLLGAPVDAGPILSAQSSVVNESSEIASEMHPRSGNLRYLWPPPSESSSTARCTIMEARMSRPAACRCGKVWALFLERNKALMSGTGHVGFAALNT